MSSASVESRADAAHGSDEVGQSLEREVFAVERNEHRVRGHERVEGEEAERRWGIDEDVVEVAAQR